MNKEDAGALGSGIVVLAIFIYGFKSKQGWKYWLFTLLILPAVGFSIGYALGRKKPSESEMNQEACKIQKCKTMGGVYSNGTCIKYEHGEYQPQAITGC